MGQLIRAIELYEQALEIDREVSNRQGKGTILTNLGNCYYSLGQLTRAIELYEQALGIHREIGNRQGEGNILTCLAGVFISDGRFSKALVHATQSIQIGEELNSPVLGSYGNSYLALTHLYLGNFPAARTAVEAACQYDEPNNNPYVFALLGVVTLQQGDIITAQKAFTTAVTNADNLLTQSAQSYWVLDVKGIALCGLTLCREEDCLTSAIEAYRAARTITKAEGIVKDALRLFDALAVVDVEGKLAAVRAAVAGE